MNIERSKNASRNILFGTLLKIYGILLPFVMRSLIVYELGVKYLGLGSLFTSILEILNLAELGVESAIVFSMYKPIVEDDGDKIKAYLHLYKIYYRIIGGVILGAGLILTPFVPRLIKDTVPDDINVYILYLLNLLATVLTYWLFSYRKSILSAHQRNDVISKVTIATDTAKYLLQIFVLVAFKNYYYYVLAILLSHVLNNIATLVVSKKMYPQYEPEGTLSKEERDALNKRVKDLFTSRFGGVVLTSADAVVISAFLGLEVLAVYQNYYLIMKSVIGFIAIIYTSIVAGVGNSMIVKSLEKNKQDFHTFTFLVAWLSTICVSCFLSLYQPFMVLWMGEGMLLPFEMVVLFCVYFWVYELDKMVTVYKDAGGIWHQDRYRPLITGLVNLGLNILMVQFVGLYGVVLSTVISFAFISVPWIISNVFKLIFKSSPKKYSFEIILYTIGVFAIGAVSFGLASLIPVQGILGFIIKGITAVVASNGAFILVFMRSPYFPEAKRLLLKLLRFNS